MINFIRIHVLLHILDNLIMIVTPRTLEEPLPEPERPLSWDKHELGEGEKPEYSV